VEVPSTGCRFEIVIGTPTIIAYTMKSLKLGSWEPPRPLGRQQTVVLGTPGPPVRILAARSARRFGT